MNYDCGLHPSACGLPVYLYGGAGRRRGGVRRIQLSMCKHSSWEPRWKWLFSSNEGIFLLPIVFNTESTSLKHWTLSHCSPVAQRVLCICLLTKYFCVMACVYWDSCKLEKKHECAGGNISPISCKCSLESSPDTSLKNTDHLCFLSLQTSDMWTEHKSYL